MTDDIIILSPLFTFSKQVYKYTIYIQQEPENYEIGRRLLDSRLSPINIKISKCSVKAD